MLRSILVPLDGSPLGEHALPLALDIARRAGANLELAHVYLTPSPLFAGPRPNMESPLDARGRAQARAYLDRLTGRVRAAAEVPVTSALLEGGVADALEAHAVTRGVDLVAMTTHGRGVLSRLWQGSVADELLRRLPMPLLLVRPREGETDPGQPPALQHILVPVDGSPLAEQALTPALELSAQMHARYTLLEVIEPLLYTGDGFAGIEAQSMDAVLFRQLEEEARVPRSDSAARAVPGRPGRDAPCHRPPARRCHPGRG